MPRKNNIERERVEGQVIENEVVAKVEPVKKKREMSEEQKERQRENLRKGREALKEKREAGLKEKAKMLHDTVVEIKEKKPKKDTKMDQLLKAVASLDNDVEEEQDEEVIVVKKKKAPKRKVVVVEEESDDEPLPPPPTKPKRTYTKRTPVERKTAKKVYDDADDDEPQVAIAVAPKPQIMFY
jgi:hypothetical protein